VHGTAPDITGKGLANPIAAILSGAMLLEYLGHPQAARRIRNATGEVLQSGNTLSRDLGGSATTRQITDAIITAMHARPSSAADRA
jgi:isocitrate/isopropylmalate dehydrogenase